MYWLTQSLLGSWQHFLDADDAYSNHALSSFLSTLRREPLEPTNAMQAGISFENDINCSVIGTWSETGNQKYDSAVRRFSRLCDGGQPQVPVSGRVFVDGMQFQLYGICDYVKAGMIYDIKRVQRYEYGKYFHSPQHPMYLYMIPQALKFTYLIFDGKNQYTETYRRGDFPPLETTISGFIKFLKENKYLDDYQLHWKMNDERMELTYGL